MTIKWHKLILICTTCQIEPTIEAINSSSDGEILVEMYCPKCEKRLGYITSGQKLVAKSFISDMAEEIKPVRPPIKKKETKTEDHNFLKEMGIKDEE